MIGQVDANFGVAVQAVFLLGLAFMLTGVAAELTGRRVRVLPAAVLVALPSDLAPQRRRLLCAAYLVTGLGPQAWMALLVVVPPEGVRDNARALAGLEVAVAALWVLYLARLPRQPGARWQDWRLPADEAPTPVETADVAKRPRVNWTVWVGMGAAMIGVTVYAWWQLAAVDPDIGRVGVSGIMAGLLFIIKGATLRRVGKSTWTGG